MTEKSKILGLVLVFDFSAHQNCKHTCFTVFPDLLMFPIINPSLSEVRAYFCSIFIMSVRCGHVMIYY